VFGHEDILEGDRTGDLEDSLGFPVVPSNGLDVPGKDGQRSSE